MKKAEKEKKTWKTISIRIPQEMLDCADHLAPVLFQETELSCVARPTRSLVLRVAMFTGLEQFMNIYYETNMGSSDQLN